MWWMPSVVLTRSPKKFKKWRAVIDETHVVDFGARGYSDFTLHRSALRMRRYLRRHGAVEVQHLSPDSAFESALQVRSSSKETWDAQNGMTTPGFWSRWLLWSHPSLADAIAYIRDSFDVQFHISRARCNIRTSAQTTVRGSISLQTHGAGMAQTRFHCRLKGLTPGQHGLHVHRCADFSQECASTCEHYNPTGEQHGGPRGTHRHRGDFGNVHAAASGICTTTDVVDVTVGEIVGRAFVVHADADDLGEGKRSRAAESKKTGNAGARIACGKIVPVI